MTFGVGFNQKLSNVFSKLPSYDEYIGANKANKKNNNLISKDSELGQRLGNNYMIYIPGLHDKYEAVYSKNPMGFREIIGYQEKSTNPGDYFLSA